MKSIVLALTLLLGISTIASAQNAATKENLRGLTGVRLMVMFGHCPTRDPSNCAEGLDEAQRPEILKMLEDETTAKLQNAGIPLFKYADEIYKAGTPRLVVVVTMDKLNGFNHPLETEVKLMQRVLLARDTTIETDAVTWNLGGVGGPKLEIPMIRRQVAGLIDRFIEDYWSVNPKQSANSAKADNTKH